MSTVFSCPSSFLYFCDTSLCVTADTPPPLWRLCTIRCVVVPIAEGEPASPPLQEQEYQVQWVRSTVCVPLGVECLEFLHPHDSEWLIYLFYFQRLKISDLTRDGTKCVFYLFIFCFSTRRRDICCIPAAFGKTIPMCTSGMTDVY